MIKKFVVKANPELTDLVVDLVIVEAKNEADAIMIVALTMGWNQSLLIAEELFIEEN